LTPKYLEQEHKQGPYYEEIKIGDTIIHQGGRTITDTDNIWFTLLTCNTNQIHYNKEYTEANFSSSPFNGRLVVNSLFVFSVLVGLSVGDTSKNGIMLGINNWKATNPVFAGDTVHAESEVISKRESKSHRSMGIVTIRTKGFKQGNIPVMEFERTFMVRKLNKKWK
jgi:itaconyl-CoA hydratase